MWAAKWYSKNKRDGETTHIIHNNGLAVVFRTRRECREFIKARYGFIARRADLRAEPHGWRVPKAVKCAVVETC